MIAIPGKSRNVLIFIAGYPKRGAYMLIIRIIALLADAGGWDILIGVGDHVGGAS